MHNILVINPPNKPFTNNSIIAEPIDLLEIATILKKHKVKVIDMDASRVENNINKYLDKKRLNILIFVYDYLIPLHTPDTINNIFEIIRNADANIKTVVIGKTASVFHKHLLENNVDVIIAGKVEDRIIKVINNINNLSTVKGLYLKKGYTGDYKIKYHYKKNPIANRKLLDQKNYMDTKTMITSRGCNGSCAFCSTPKFLGKWEAKNSSQVVKEIKYLIKNFNTKQILFLDDNFTVDKKRVIEICDLLIKKKMKIKMGCLSSVKNYDSDMFKKMYQAGFRWVHMGIESGSEEILKKMNKNMSIDNIKNIVIDIKNIGYRIRTSFILDYPNQTDGDFVKTIELIRELKTDEVRLHFLAKRAYTDFFNNDSINDQYIHENKIDKLNSENKKALRNLLDELKSDSYKVIESEADWNKVKSNKIISFTPLKYGINWHE